MEGHGHHDHGGGERPTDTPVLSLVLRRYADDTITDEQIQRILEPVRWMLWERRPN